ncbi:hypothetical protein DAPK24_034640 [Pichia kluyveri]|uniref:Uncharacterized protein n=1 Tax=Pichia kluyveri TaxID=36015 RepID=A0AAV5R5W0_PICKL|nr:hypothetical protein DAPK24_034640 [Pichia kluyveri]
MVKTSPSVNTNTKRILTKQQKDKIISRLENELKLREIKFMKTVDSEISLLHLKFNNRLNKILRKFWDVKLCDILNIERELTNNDRLTLVSVIKSLEKQKQKQK